MICWTVWWAGRRRRSLICCGRWSRNPSLLRGALQRFGDRLGAARRPGVGAHAQRPPHARVRPTATRGGRNHPPPQQRFREVSKRRLSVVLELRDLVKHYQVGGGEPIRAVDGVSMTVARGEFVAMYGPSGSGKTTLIELIAGLQLPRQWQRAGRRPRCGRDVPQGGRRLPAAHPRDGHAAAHPEPWRQGDPQRLAEAAAGNVRSAPRPGRTAAGSLGLGDRLHHRTEQLSMGERQRVLIALRAVESTQARARGRADRTSIRSAPREVLGLLRDLCREREMALLLATHDPEAAAFADQVHELRDGRLGEVPPGSHMLSWSARGPRLDHRRLGADDGTDAPVGRRATSTKRALKSEGRAHAGGIRDPRDRGRCGAAVRLADLEHQPHCSSVTQLNSQLVGSAQLQLDARGPEGFPERLLGEVRRVPGVQVALPILERQVNVIGPRGRERSVDLIGVEPQTRCAPAARCYVASPPVSSPRSTRSRCPHRSPTKSAPGHWSRSGCRSARHVIETLVGATLEEADIGGLVHSPVAVTSDRLRAAADGAPGQIHQHLRALRTGPLQPKCSGARAAGCGRGT